MSQKVVASNDQVLVKVVKNVLDFDFPQAIKAWEALADAGIDPEELVANGLAKGHGYEIESYNLPGSYHFLNEKALLGESITSTDALISYRYIEDWTRWIVSPQNTEQALMVIGENKMIKMEEDNSPKAVQVTAILRKTPKKFDLSGSLLPPGL